jgi:RimJ/RimL family protein N-acetyltransferase
MKKKIMMKMITNFNKFNNQDLKFNITNTKFKLKFNNIEIGTCSYMITKNSNFFPGENVIELYSLEINEYYQNKKYGSYFLNKIIEFSKSKDIEIITLSVMNNNEPALKLYIKFNFEIFKPGKYYSEMCLKI